MHNYITNWATPLICSNQHYKIGRTKMPAISFRIMLWLCLTLPHARTCLCIFRKNLAWTSTQACPILYTCLVVPSAFWTQYYIVHPLQSHLTRHPLLTSARVLIFCKELTRVTWEPLESLKTPEHSSKDSDIVLRFRRLAYGTFYQNGIRRAAWQIEAIGRITVFIS